MDGPCIIEAEVCVNMYTTCQSNEPPTNQNQDDSEA